MAINRLQPVLARDLEYTKQFPGSDELDSPPPLAEVQAPVRQPAQQAPDLPAASVQPIEPAAVEPASVQAAPVEAPTPAARTREKPVLQRAVAPAPAKKAKASRVRTAKVSVWVRPLLEHAGRIEATGLPSQRVLKAAWKRTAARYSLGSTYVEPLPSDRAEGIDYRYATTLQLDADALTSLLHEHDPLRITPYWSLIRGQVEPLFWQALDEVLTELDQANRAQQGATKP